ncbi:MAG: glycerate kinase type-2 family protein [Phycisphaerae bacterium]
MAKQTDTLTTNLGVTSTVWNPAQARSALLAIFMAAVQSADPRKVLAAHLPHPPSGRCVVVGCGKSAAVMAAAVEAAWPEVALSGLVVTRYGHAVPTRHIAVMESAHPVPDTNSELAAERILERVRGLGPQDLVLALISGGGSALMSLPGPGLTLSDKQAINQALLLSGATIHEINAVRKHLSAIKGGRLAQAAAPARVVTLAISDVPGDDPAVIASGPTFPDTTTIADVRAILSHYNIPLSAAVERYLQQAPETPKPGEFTADYRLLTTPMMGLKAAATTAATFGVHPVVLGELEGESRDLGIAMAGIARSIRNHSLPVAPPAVVLSGGETTVTIGQTGAGKGGRNMEFVLSLAVALHELPGVWAVAGDTDGIDGFGDAAGAYIDSTTLGRAKARGFDPVTVLHQHDSFTMFDALGDLIRTGPTLTNINALRAVVIG